MLITFVVFNKSVANIRQRYFIVKFIWLMNVKSIKLLAELKYFTGRAFE